MNGAAVNPTPALRKQRERERESEKTKVMITERHSHFLVIIITHYKMTPTIIQSNLNTFGRWLWPGQNQPFKLF